MLKLRELNVCFGDNIIYDHASFTAFPNELTVVMGKSGSGKSTLHDIITFHSQCHCIYQYNDRSLNTLDLDEQREFVKEKMGIVNQSPFFINDLTIEDHIGLCQTLLNGYEVDQYIHQLEIEDILNKYPLQLSGGEKMRASILLALIKQPEILVFDEPTSSLDQHHTELIVSLLSDYAHSGHTVIIFSHDRFMKEKADCFYHIENHGLKLIKHEEVEIHETMVIQPIKKKQEYQMYIHNMVKHKRVFKLSMLVIVALAIGLSSFSFFFGQSFIDEYKHSLDNILKAGVIYKENPKETIPIMNGEDVIEENELENLQSIQEITGLQPFMSIWITNNEHSKEKYKLFQNDELVCERPIKENHSQPRVGSYAEDENYPIPQLDYNIDVDEGIYISSAFLFHIVHGFENFPYYFPDEAKELYESIDENTTIELMIRVPQYTVRDQNGKFSHMIYHDEMVRTKIKGIFSKMHGSPIDFIGNNGNSYDLYFPLELQQRIQKELFKETGYEIEKVGTDYYYPAIPQYYSFVVKDGYSMSDAKEKIEALGYKVVSNYYDIEVQMSVVEDLNEGLVLISSLIMIVVLMLFVGVKYNQKKDYHDFIHFFTNLGFSYEEGRKYLKCYFRYETLRCLILSLILIYAIMYYSFKKAVITYIILDIKLVILNTILAGIIEIVIPLLILGREEA